MITFLTLPRPFVGEFDRLQRLALQSWQGAVPGCEVLVFGHEPGIAEVVRELGLIHCPGLTYNAAGHPLADQPFALGEQQAAHEWLCFCSADIVFGGDLLPAFQAVQQVERPFVVGQRWDIEPGTVDPEQAVLHPPCGIDYFLYRRGTIGPVLPFTIGGGGCDQWILWKALTAWRMTVIDATADITAVHVNHGYPLWPEGKRGREGSPEQLHNRRLYQADGMTRLCGIDDAPWVLRGGQIERRG